MQYFLMGLIRPCDAIDWVCFPGLEEDIYIIILFTNCLFFYTGPQQFSIIWPLFTALPFFEFSIATSTLLDKNFLHHLSPTCLNCHLGVLLPGGLAMNLSASLPGVTSPMPWASPIWFSPSLSCPIGEQTLFSSFGPSSPVPEKGIKFCVRCSGSFSNFICKCFCD